MKNLIISIIFIATNLAVFSQYNPALDNKNGFKDFKFGDSRLSYYGKIGSDGIKYNDGSIQYEYLLDSPNSLFGYNWSYLYLGFYGDKLGVIDLVWVSADEDIFNNIRLKLEKIFGEDYLGEGVDSHSIYQFDYSYTDSFLYKQYTWEGYNVKMYLNAKFKKRKWIDGKLEDVNYRISLNIKSLEIEKESLKNGF